MPKRTNEDFFFEASRFADITPQKAEKYWRGYVEAIIRRLYLEGSIYLPMIGEINTKTVKQQTQIHRHPVTNELVEYISTPHVRPVFKPEDGFIDDINGFGVGKRYRYREKKNQLTARDFERMERLAAIEADKNNKDLYGTKAAYQEKFRELLAKKRIKTEEKEKNDETTE